MLPYTRVHMHKQQVGVEANTPMRVKVQSKQLCDGFMMGAVAVVLLGIEG